MTEAPALAAPDFTLRGSETLRKLNGQSYDTQLHACQERLRAVQLGYLRHAARGIVVMEGWDASGKGGVIRRMAAVMEPRACSFWAIGPPEASWQGRHYLARFWPLLPEPGRISVFDRSWYGRVLVERVEGLTGQAAWQRAYDEINAFERMLLDDGVRIVKIFMHVSPKEQLRRFQSRIDEPLKRWKMTMADIRNRELRHAYEKAVDEMVQRTSTVRAPWHVVPADCKKYARVHTLGLIADGLGAGLDLGPPPLARDVARAARERLGLEVPEAPT